MPTASFTRDEAAVASSVIVFLVAGLIFTGSIGAVLLMSRSSNSGVAATNAPAASLNGQAKSLAQLLLESPGYSATGSDWVAGGINSASATQQAEGLKRLGLKDATSSDPSMLNFSKFQNLRRAPYGRNATDGYVNYEEARTWLGLAATSLDFHVRAYPTLQSVAELLANGHRDPNLRIAYIGDIAVAQTYAHNPPPTPTTGLTVAAPTCALSPLATNLYRLSTTVTNGGIVDTQFSGLFTYNLAGTGAETQNSNTFLVPAGAARSLYIDVPAAVVTHGGTSTLRSCAAGSTITVDVLDPLSNKVSASATLGAAVSGAATAPHDLWLDTSKPYYVNNGASCDSVVVGYDGLDVAKNDKFAIKVIDNATGTQVLPASGHYVSGTGANVNPDSSDASFYTFVAPNPDQKKTITIGCLPVGTYKASLFYYTSGHPSASDEMVQEKILVTAASLPAYTPSGTDTVTGTAYTPSAAAITEVGYLNTLAKRFCPTYFDSQSASPIAGQDWSVPANGVGSDDDFAHRCDFKGGTGGGDIFPDSKTIMNDDLASRLINSTTGKPRYDRVNILVAGSNVDQTAMTSQSAKGSVGDWVLGGGTLIVLGSDAQNVNWLEPIFHSAIRSSSGPLGTPDPGNPLLHVPDELDYPHYDNANRTWSFNGQTAQDAANLFGNVVVQGGNPVTTISNAGAFGDGRVILTTWRPNDLYQPDRDAESMRLEGMKLVNNMLMQGYQGLFLDYGPSLPPLANVVPAVRSAQIMSPFFAEPIQMSIVVFVFK